MNTFTTEDRLADQRTANELADDMENHGIGGYWTPSKTLLEAATMLRQQQEKIEKYAAVISAVEHYRDAVGYEKVMLARDGIWQAMDEIDE